jgi:site-specific recombinase XerD
MPYIRKLPSGLWQATVRHPSGRRLSKTDALKRVVAKWGRDLEAKFARGDVRDPRAGQITVGEWYDRWIAARGVEPGTATKLGSIWRTHCTQWATWPMDAITAMEAQEWVNVVKLKRRARHRGRPVADDEDSPVLAATTIREAVNLMSSLYRAAMKGHAPIMLSNPFHDLDLPTVPPAPIDFLTHEEVDDVVAAVRTLRPDEPDWPLLIEMGTWMGLRLGEMYGLAGTGIDWLRRDVQVTQVMTRSGLRGYPKTRKSFRTVPIPRAGMKDELAALFTGRGRDALAFTRPEGGPVEDSWFRHRVWVPALELAGVRPLPPRVMRHTAASWLVMDGVPLYDVQALLGHESITTTQRYAHLAPGAHEKVRESWRRTSDARTNPVQRKAGPA